MTHTLPTYRRNIDPSVWLQSSLLTLSKLTELFSGAHGAHNFPSFTMPAIVNLLFNVVSTNTTISFHVVLPTVSLVSLLVGVGGTCCCGCSVLLLNLSLADLGALLTLPCVLLSASFQDWQLGGGTCVLLGFMTSVTVGAEIFSLAVLSLLRYRIVAPLTSPPASLVQVLCAVVAIWLISITMALPKVTYINFDGGCTWSVGRDEWLFFLVPAFLVYYVAPLSCITINCGLIVYQLYRCRAFQETSAALAYSSSPSSTRTTPPAHDPFNALTIVTQ
ncbi:hypothetical protein WMY93_000873 [Mugilogobius chulae]|uniref:G-protein coupled receptors family 1 profile domain-containing protein n=1 Tax=Mugilogobius chulae TaxID=88201 RepID=A0AAW0QBA7_9GOBI